MIASFLSRKFGLLKSNCMHIWTFWNLNFSHSKKSDMEFSPNQKKALMRFVHARNPVDNHSLRAANRPANRLFSNVRGNELRFPQRFVDDEKCSYGYTEHKMKINPSASDWFLRLLCFLIHTKRWCAGILQRAKEKQLDYEPPPPINIQKTTLHCEASVSRSIMKRKILTIVIRLILVLDFLGS